MTIAEKLAKQFHEAYERIAPAMGYETRKESAVPWEEVPEKNRKTMIATCQNLLERGIVIYKEPVRPSATFCQETQREYDRLYAEDHCISCGDELEEGSKRDQCEECWRTQYP